MTHAVPKSPTESGRTGLRDFDRQAGGSLHDPLVVIRTLAPGMPLYPPVLTPPIPVVLPLIVAALLALLSRRMPDWLASALAIATAAAVGGVAISMVVYTRMEPLVYWWGGALPRDQAATGLGFVIDTTTGTLIFLASLLVTAVVIYSKCYFEHPGPGFDAILLTLLAGAGGIAETGDLLTLLLFFELMAGAAYALSKHKTEGDPTHFGVVNAAGALLALAGIAIVYARTGAINMAHIGRALDGHADPATGAAFALVACGLLIQAGVVPFQFGLIDGHKAASPAVGAVLSGIVAPLGLYAVTRVYWTCFSGVLEIRQNDVRNLLAAFGAVSALAGAAMCYVQRDVKRLLAYSTVSQMGIALLGIAMLTPRGLGGAELTVMSHALAKGGLFLAAGMLIRRLGSGSEADLAGRGCELRGIGSLFVLGGAALAGVPPFAFYWGQTMLDGAARDLGYFWIPWVIFAAAAIGAAAIFRFSYHVFFGHRWRGEEFGVHGSVVESSEAKAAHSTTPAALYAPAAALIALALFSGMFSRITGAAEGAAVHVQDRVAYAQRVLEMLTPLPPTVRDLAATPGDILRGAALLVVAAAIAGLSVRRRPRPAGR